MIRLRDLAEKAIEATTDDPEGSCLTLKDIYWRLDVNGSRKAHLQNPLNHPGTCCLRPRERPLTADSFLGKGLRHQSTGFVEPRLPLGERGGHHDGKRSPFHSRDTTQAEDAILPDPSQRIAENTDFARGGGCWRY